MGGQDTRDSFLQYNFGDILGGINVENNKVLGHTEWRFITQKKEILPPSRPNEIPPKVWNDRSTTRTQLYTFDLMFCSLSIQLRCRLYPRN